jgi:hypothetical protein
MTYLLFGTSFLAAFAVGYSVGLWFGLATRVTNLEAYLWASPALPRCEGRYPVPPTSPPREEPFSLTLSCGRAQGHPGPHGPETETPS